LQGETWSDGDVIYLSPTTAGALTNVKPSAPSHIVVIGYVEYAHANNGKLYVKIMNGWELEELHDVVPTPYIDKGVLYRDTATNLWKSATISSLLGYIPGTVTSVALTVPTGLVITSGSPITSSGTIAVGLQTGYSIPTTVKQSNWDDAYTFVGNFPTQTGNNGKYLTTNGSTLSWATIDLTGYVPTSRTLTINGTSYDLSANRSWSVGTVTSVDLSVPTGLSISGNPITDSGTLAISLAAGYSIPTTASQTNWDTAYTFVNGFPSQTGNSGKYLTTDGSTFSWGTVSTSNIYNADGTLTGNRTVTSGGFTLNFTGSVGIGGTPTGSYGKLSVFGGISMKNDNNAKLEIGRFSAGSPSSYIKLGTSSDGLRINNAAETTDIMTLFNNGNLLLDSGITLVDTGYKIDANGTSRFRDNMLIVKSQNAPTSLNIQNLTNGVSALAYLNTQSNSGSNAFGKFSSSNTGYLFILGGDGYISNSGGGDLSILNDVSTGKIKFGAGSSSTAQMTLTAAGRLLLGTVTEGTYLLDVNGTGRFTGMITSGNGLFDAPTSNLVFTVSSTSGNRNVQIGNFGGVTFTGIRNVAIGSNTINTNTVSHSTTIGSGNSSNGGISIGYNNTTLANNGIAIGLTATSHANSCVIGTEFGTSSSGSGQFVVEASNWFIRNPALSGQNGSAGTINGCGVSGTDLNGGNITIAGGKGTGTGTPGDVIFSTATATTTGTTLQSLTIRASIKGGTGQLVLNNYTSSTSFSGTAAGYLAFDSSGNVITTSGTGSGGGGITRSVNNISTTTTAGATASTDYVYLVSGTTTLTMPTAVGNTNRYTIKNVGTNTITINTTSSQTIDGSTSITIAVRYTTLDLISDGTNWNII